MQLLLMVSFEVLLVFFLSLYKKKKKKLHASPVTTRESNANLVTGSCCAVVHVRMAARGLHYSTAVTTSTVHTL